MRRTDLLASECKIDPISQRSLGKENSLGRLPNGGHTKNYQDLAAPVLVLLGA